MVSLALTIFLLSILAQAFVMGGDTFTSLKAVGDLNQSLSTAANMLRTDLAADHFEGKRRLSDSQFWVTGPPQQGYFCVYTPATATVEGTDADGLPSYRNIGPVVLAFTVKSKGNRPQDYYSIAAPLPAVGNVNTRYQQAGNFNSQWIEVCYFVAPLGGVTAGGTPLYALYRQQRLVVGDVDGFNWGLYGSPQIPFVQAVLYQNKISCQQNPSNVSKLYFNSPADLSMPVRRTACTFNYNLPVAPTPPAPFKNLTTKRPTGEDLLLLDVLSFDVRVFQTGGTDFLPLPRPFYFDSWSKRRDDKYDYSTKAVPSALSIQAIQITMRIWSPGANVARQITIVQEL